MKIAFLDLINWDYRVESVYEISLGGTQSAICYLALELAKQQEEVFLLNNTTQAKISHQVVCLPVQQLPPQLWHELDVLVVSNLAGLGKNLKSQLPEDALLILWNQHSYDQPPVQSLQESEERNCYDGIAFVSNWQRDRFHEHFNIDLIRAGVMRNAVSVYFLEMFLPFESILAYKSKPPVLAYTSTPFRGLDLLLEVFPLIRNAVPGTRLKVFSSMKVYQVDDTQDRLKYGGLYRLCQETEGVEYVGSLPQEQLAKELKSVSVLAYPNTFAETSCISVMEAMASGCWVVTSNLGALSETTAGFGSLIPVDDNWQRYKQQFVEVTVAVLKNFLAEDTTELQTNLRKQVDFVNNSYVWSKRANEWREWIGRLGGSALEKARESFFQGNYSQSVNFYHQGIKFCPENRHNYWYLGLSWLLQGEKAKAEDVWMSVIFNATSEEVEILVDDLKKVLENELTRLEAIANFPYHSLIRECLDEFTGE